MNHRQSDILGALQRVQEFCIGHPLPQPSAPYTAMVADLASVIAGITHQAADQSAGDAEAKSATNIRQALLTTLREQHMIPLKQLANALLGDVQGIAQKFRVPLPKARSTEILASARGMIEHAQAYADVFIAHGRPADFLTQMQGVVDAIDSQTQTRFSGVRRRLGAGGGLLVSIAEARKILTFLDVVIRTAFAGDPQALLEWRRSKRFSPVVSSNPAAPTGSAPAGSAASTTATGSPSAAGANGTTSAASSSTGGGGAQAAPAQSAA